MQCRSRAACWQISYPRSSDITPTIPLENADWHGGGGSEPSLEQQAVVRWALGQLPPDARALVWLHDVEGYTAEELTERFGCKCGVPAPAVAPRCKTGCANCWNEPSGSIYPKFPPNLPSLPVTFWVLWGIL
jgi:hypothetical protein